MKQPQFSTDGGQTWFGLVNLRIVVPRVDDDPENEEARDLVIKVTDAGLLLDMVGVDSGVGYSSANLTFEDLDGMTS